jgi:hypothetical protein
VIESLIPIIVVILVVALLIWVVEATIGPIPPPIKIGIIIIIALVVLIYALRILGISDSFYPARR